MEWDKLSSSLLEEKETKNKKKLLSISIILVTILIGSIITIPFQIDDASASTSPAGKKFVKKQIQVADAPCREPDIKLEKSDSKAASLNLIKGNDFHDNGQYQKALQYYDMAIDEDPNFAVAYLNKGLVLSKLGKYQEAFEYYDKALDEDSDYSKALYGKGNVLSALGKHEEAIEYYEKALEEESDFAQALNAIGDALYRLGKYEEAIEYYDKALDEDPRCMSALKWKNIAQDKLDNNNNNVVSIRGEKIVKKVPIKRSSTPSTTNFIGGGGNMTPASPASTTDFVGGGNMTPASPLPPIVDDNTPPVSSGSSITTTTDKSIDTQLLASDQDNDELTASIVSTPSNGVLSDINQENGMVTYTPNSGFTGNDHFSFKVNDGKADSNSAQITVTISQENNPPSAHDTTVTTNVNKPIDIKLPASDPDPNDELTASIVSAPSSGTLSDINQNTGIVTYTPNTGFASSDSFMFQVNDGKADSNSGLVQIAITKDNINDCKEVPTQVTDGTNTMDSKLDPTNSKALLQKMTNCDPTITPSPTTPTIGVGNNGLASTITGATTTKDGTTSPITNPTTKIDAGSNKGAISGKGGITNPTTKIDAGSNKGAVGGSGSETSGTKSNSPFPSNNCVPGFSHSKPLSQIDMLACLCYNVKHDTEKYLDDLKDKLKELFTVKYWSTKYEEHQQRQIKEGELEIKLVKDVMTTIEQHGEEISQHILDWANDPLNKMFPKDTPLMFPSDPKNTEAYYNGFYNKYISEGSTPEQAAKLATIMIEEAYRTGLQLYNKELTNIATDKIQQTLMDNLDKRILGELPKKGELPKNCEVCDKKTTDRSSSFEDIQREQSDKPINKGIGEKYIDPDPKKRCGANVDLAVCDYKDIEKYRDPKQVGKNIPKKDRLQGAHISPTSSLSDIEGFTKMLTKATPLPKFLHDKADEGWKKKARELVKLGQTEISAKEWKEIVKKSYESVPELKGRTADTMGWVLDLEFCALGIDDNTMLRIPWSLSPQKLQPVFQSQVMSDDNNMNNFQQKQPFSIADELSKLVNLRDQGIITEVEFNQLKQNAIQKSIIDNEYLMTNNGGSSSSSNSGNSGITETISDIYSDNEDSLQTQSFTDSNNNNDNQQDNTLLSTSISTYDSMGGDSNITDNDITNNGGIDEKEQQYLQQQEENVQQVGNHTGGPLGEVGEAIGKLFQ